MSVCELINRIKEDGEALATLYSDVSSARQRYISAVEKFGRLFGEDRDIQLLSVPGRSEICGNHTDHNNGRVLAGAIDRDVIAVAARNDDGVIRIQSEGYPLCEIALSDIDNPDAFAKYSSDALVAGVAYRLSSLGYLIGGVDVYSETQVLKGSGISSSAAYEVMIGNIFSHLYNGGCIDNKELAKAAQYAENVYFGKPCGLMDQMACAVGGFVFIDFEDNKNPVVEPIDFSIRDKGYALCIVNTGGNHADLNEDYASVPREMREVAGSLGREVLRGITEGELIENIPTLREKVGDRAILRALHFIRENERVTGLAEALRREDIDTALGIIRESGRSSFEYLQNVYTNVNIREQGLSLALAVTDGFLAGEGASRVHGGGFAGTVQVFLPTERMDGYVRLMNGVFGEGAAVAFNIRGVGACRLF